MKLLSSPKAILLGLAVRFAKEFLWDHFIDFLKYLSKKTENTKVDDDLVEWINKQKEDFDKLIDYALERL
jgi:hypothetical protein